MTEHNVFVDDLTVHLATATGDGVQWTLPQSADLNVNLVHLEPGATIDEHVAAEVDVVVIVLAGSGTLVSRNRSFDLRVHALVHVPAGVPRALHAHDGGFTYLTVHRRRAGLQIGTRRKSSG
jgi:quercetin dioxygenase-like cupin family protein